MSQNHFTRRNWCSEAAKKGEPEGGRFYIKEIFNLTDFEEALAEGKN